MCLRVNSVVTFLHFVLNVCRFLFVWLYWLWCWAVWLLTFVWYGMSLMVLVVFGEACRLVCFDDVVYVVLGFLFSYFGGFRLRQLLLCLL